MRSRISARPPLGARFTAAGNVARSVVLSAALAAGCSASGSLVSDARAPDDVRPAALPDVGLTSICKEITQPLSHLSPAPDVLVLFDRSGSMATEFGGGTRLGVETALLTELLGVYHDKIRFGLQVFPGPDECGTAFAGCCVEGPVVPVGARTAPRISGIMKALIPGGGTPTADALRLARAYFSAIKDGPEEQYVLLSTDGRPSCSRDGVPERDLFDADGERIAGPCRDALEEVDALVAAGVKVIVLGIGPGLESDPGGRPSCLEDLAKRGEAPRPGGRPSFYPAGDPQELERALQQIFGGVTRPSCTVELTAPPPNPGQVALFFDGREVPRSREHGWEYETTDDGTVSPRRLRVHGEYCRRLERFQVSVVEVRFGCPPCRDLSRCE